MTAPGQLPLPDPDRGGFPRPGTQQPAAPAAAGPAATPQRLGHTRTSGAWAGLVLGGALLILLLVFILQNGGESAFHFLGFDFTLPRGVALLLAAAAGGSIMSVVGAVRIFQLRRAYKHARP